MGYATKVLFALLASTASMYGSAAALNSSIPEKSVASQKPFVFASFDEAVSALKNSTATGEAEIGAQEAAKGKKWTYEELTNEERQFSKTPINVEEVVGLYFNYKIYCETSSASPTTTEIDELVDTLRGKRTERCVQNNGQYSRCSQVAKARGGQVGMCSLHGYLFSLPCENVGVITHLIAKKCATKVPGQIRRAGGQLVFGDQWAHQIILY